MIVSSFSPSSLTGNKMEDLQLVSQDDTSDMTLLNKSANKLRLALNILMWTFA